MDSQKENVLKETMINATYDYLLHIRTPWMMRMIKETVGLIVDDTHFLYQFAIQTHNISNEEKLELGVLYRKLALGFHPDKCKEIWSQDVFTLINKFHVEGNLPGLIQFEEILNDFQLTNNWDHIRIQSMLTIQNSDSDSTIPSNPTIIQKEELINLWKTQNWYLWCIGDEGVRSLFVTPEVYCEHKRAQEQYQSDLAKLNNSVIQLDNELKLW